MTNQPAPAAAVPTETAWDKIIGRPDKPFHKPECCCAECEVWKAANPTPPAEPAAASEVKVAGWYIAEGWVTPRWFDGKEIYFDNGATMTFVGGHPKGFARLIPVTALAEANRKLEEAVEKLRTFRLNYDPAILAAFPLETDAPRLAAELATARQENERLRAENESAREDWERRCGCRNCVCENEERCEGCGSHECSYHNRLRRDLEQQLATLTQKLAAAEQRAERAEAACVAYHLWIISESHWENFREEYSVGETMKAKNAKNLRDWLAANGVENVGRDVLDELTSLRARLANAVEVVRGPCELEGTGWLVCDEPQYDPNSASITKIAAGRMAMRSMPAEGE